MNQLYINGQYVESTSGKSLPVINPATEEILDHIPDSSVEQVREAIPAAKAAQPAWNKRGSKEKAGLLHELSRNLGERAKEIAKLLTEEAGKPYKENYDEVIWAQTAFDYYAEAARHDAGRMVGPTKENQMDLIIKEPYGVTAHILPYNYPIVLMAWQVASALASGNTCVIKPSEFTSLSTLLMASSFDILPSGVFNVVTGGPAVGKELVENRDVGIVAFTGSANTARKIMTMAADQLKPTLIEAGGNNPFIVCEDCKLDVAVKGAAFSAFLNAGQVCTGTGRFYVQESIYEEFTEKLVEFTKTLRIGNGLDKVDIGPQTTEAQYNRLVKVVQEAVDQGAKILCGGGRPDGLDKGFYYAPTVLTNVRQDMTIMQEEVFGPVAPVMPVKDIDEAIALAEDNQYGLGAVIYTNSLDYAMKAATSIKAGTLWINDPLRDNDAAPFGGMKMSGVGRELGAEGLDAFRETKHVQIDFFQQEAPEWWFPYADEEAYSE